MMTPWSTEVSASEDGVVVELLLTTDPGPMREFRPFMDVPLDVPHATELLGKLAVALHSRRDGAAKGTADEIPQPSADRRLLLRLATAVEQFMDGDGDAAPVIRDLIAQAAGYPPVGDS